MNLEAELGEFARENQFNQRGKLGVALIVTRRAKSSGLPVDPATFLTANGTRVSGLSGSAVNSILREHGVTRSLGTEVGRTSPMSAVHMRTYVSELNRLAGRGVVDLEAVERFWVARVVDYFAQKPLSLRFDPAASVQSIVISIVAEAEERQQQAGGTALVGTVLQHLVGAKLEQALGEQITITHHSANMSDEEHGRGGDFDIGDTAIHVTARPGEGLIAKCRRNISDGIRPIIVTTTRGAAIADGLAEQTGIRDRIELIEIGQFVSTNVHELGQFRTNNVRNSLLSIIERYNEIIEECESNPSLKIALGSRGGSSGR